MVDYVTDRAGSIHSWIRLSARWEQPSGRSGWDSVNVMLPQFTCPFAIMTLIAWATVVHRVFCLKLDLATARGTVRYAPFPIHSVTLDFSRSTAACCVRWRCLRCVKRVKYVPEMAPSRRWRKLPVGLSNRRVWFLWRQSVVMHVPFCFGCRCEGLIIIGKFSHVQGCSSWRLFSHGMLLLGS